MTIAAAPSGDGPPQRHCFAGFVRNLGPLPGRH
jgi:hypothetical protein